ncbi:MAG: lysophospholipid acyltransferase family protein [Prevotellaceae bacterium]|jgi:KDO2-lipid IV(A) lauroyltransferase|nr:lysophospholipid acyltransferase family protein [Prevotellaceae bacterium]
MMFRLFYILVWLLALIPLRLLYCLSDLLFIPVYLSGYRKEVVRRNLRNAFPEKRVKELRKIERRFYRYFCDLLMEDLKLIHLSEKQIKKRIVFKNKDAAIEQYQLGKSVMLYTSHYGNWEWNAAFSLHLPKERPVYQVYKSLKNRHFDKFMYGIRRKFGAENVEKKDLMRKMISLRKEGRLGMFGMISDQSPSANHIRYWTKFLNQYTPFLDGTEQLARKFDYPVFYVRLVRKRRGYYECQIEPIELKPAETTQFEITEKYARLLEQDIRNAPQYWLWSHRRWKYAGLYEQIHQ